MPASATCKTSGKHGTNPKKELAMISYDEWMKGTYVMGYPRSPEMKAIDFALQNFKPQVPSSRRAIADALEVWKDKETKSGDLIRNARYEFPELSHFKGIVPPSINKWSNLFMAKATAFAYELETSKDEGAKFKPHVPGKAELPADFRSRIEGKGPSKTSGAD